MQPFPKSFIVGVVGTFKDFLYIVREYGLVPNFDTSMKSLNPS